ncbi:Fic family protein [Mucilaginibacter psychrotolerans]|uniref:Fic family protein n=1 Tax=Mucilaginibacter psychrotolerans TaxID=1524096 RepID=A0A4Y8S6W8_9SPHI|nr:Fic family protein [Mucilaginibacter psychrotolerans]TFF34300.1 Fic family protein [Mucilaginibacter psychrotolerans]
MSFTDKLQEIDNLQAAIEGHGQIPVTLLNKINYKLRLEWNYTSNSMEGNSLTKRETRTVMVNAIEVHGKPLKDIQEIKNHDTVITTIMKMGKGELNISESRIREIHKGIMYEEDEDKKKYVGQWKNVDNYMLNYDGERYDFVPYAEVPERMHQLVNWTNSEKEKIQRSQNDAIHPVSLALKFHLDYLNIHPFYDGNGRTARILSNLILISYGLPPFYIKENEKQNYYRYLTDIQTYGGEPDLFYEFMVGLVQRSLQITLDVIEGKEIEEEDDIDKEIALLKLRLDKSHERKEVKNWSNIIKIIEHSGIPLFQKIIAKLSKFDDLFESIEHRIIYNTDQFPKYDLQDRRGGNALSTALFPNTLLDWLHRPQLLNGSMVSFGIEYFLKGYKFSKPFNLPVFIRFVFNEYTYSISITVGYDSKDNSIPEINYDRVVENDTIVNIVNDAMKAALEIIKKESGQ